MKKQNLIFFFLLILFYIVKRIFNEFEHINVQSFSKKKLF
jgi:hypothetical protein